jgi:hypothetical protein
MAHEATLLRLRPIPEYHDLAIRGGSRNYQIAISANAAKAVGMGLPDL